MYKLDIVGLACFSKQDGRGRIVFMPDGRNPPAKIDAHTPRIVVRTEAVDSIDPSLSHTTIENATVITLPKGRIEFDGVDTPNKAQTTLDATKHDPFLQRLSDLDSSFQPNHPAGTVVTLRIRRGQLLAFRHPGSAEEDPAIVSQLAVDHQGQIRITVTPDGGSPATIKIKAGTEIVLANGAPKLNPLNTRNHFDLYANLCSNPVTFDRPAAVAVNLRRLPSSNPFFHFASGIGTHGDCGNTGCC